MLSTLVIKSLPCPFRQYKREETNLKQLAALTDEIERFLEVLLEVLMTGIRGGYLPVRDTPLLVVAGQLRGDVQHPGGAEGAQ